MLTENERVTIKHFLSNVSYLLNVVFYKTASVLNRSEFVNTFKRNLASTVCPAEENKVAPVFHRFQRSDIFFYPLS